MYFEEVNRSCQLFVLNVISDGNLNTTETKQYNTIEYYEIFQTEDNWSVWMKIRQIYIQEGNNADKEGEDSAIP